MRFGFPVQKTDNLLIEKLCTGGAGRAVYILCQDINFPPLYSTIWSHSMGSPLGVLWYSTLVPRNMDYYTTCKLLLHSASWIPLGYRSIFEMSKDCCDWSYTRNFLRHCGYFHRCATSPRNIPSQSRVSEEIGSSWSFHDCSHVFSDHTDRYHGLLIKYSGICTSGLALYYKYLIWKHQDLAWNAAKAWICM